MENGTNFWHAEWHIFKKLCSFWHLAVDKIILLFKGQVIFKQHIPMKHKSFGIIIYKLRDIWLHIWYGHLFMKGQDSCDHRHDSNAHNCETTDKKVEGHGCKLYMDIILSPDLFNDLMKQKINYCGTVRPNKKDMPQNLLPWNKWLKPGDIHSSTRDDLTAMVWRDKHDIYILTNVHDPPTDDNFCDKHGSAIKPRIIHDYKQHMEYVDKGNRMVNSFTIQRWSG
jgi:hypothetical protein